VRASVASRPTSPSSWTTPGRSTRPTQSKTKLELLAQTAERLGLTSIRRVA